LLRAANLIRLKSRVIRRVNAKRLGAIPYPAIMELKGGGFAILAASSDKGRIRLIDPIAQTAKEVPPDEAEALSSGSVILVTRRLGGAGTDPDTFGFRWFWPSIQRYRLPLAHVLVASFFVQLFALASPIFFQLIVDKVLVHKGMSTLVVLIVGMVALGLFETVLQFLRSYTLSHTTNRIDVELGRRLFHHLFRLPVAHFETRAAGQTVARLRELESIRSFLTGQGLTSLLDLVFTLIFIGVMFIYSVQLTFVLLFSIPAYVVIAGILRPFLREQINEKFNRGARSQQFLVESIVGAQTLKAAAVEPMIQAQWEERLAAYVRSSFDAGVTGALGQNLIQYVRGFLACLPTDRTACIRRDRGQRSPSRRNADIPDSEQCTQQRTLLHGGSKYSMGRHRAFAVADELPNVGTQRFQARPYELSEPPRGLRTSRLKNVARYNGVGPASRIHPLEQQVGDAATLRHL